jgi:hypothetical protein
MNIFRETFEKIKLRKRAERYKNKLDKGEIEYLMSAISNGQTVMDIGAHKAGYTYWMVKKERFMRLSPRNCFTSISNTLKPFISGTMYILKTLLCQIMPILQYYIFRLIM